MGTSAYAVFIMNTDSNPKGVSLPLLNVSAAFTSHVKVCAQDLYTGDAVSPLEPGVPLGATLPVHDSVMYCVWPGTLEGTCDGPASKECP